VGETVPAEYFVNLYKRDIDPWHFETSDYERQKYHATVQALPRMRYRNALEIACSVGVFTDLLAERCERVLAVDVSEEALARARLNCARHAHVRFKRRTMPGEFPPGSYDLVTLCEMGFYLSPDDLRTLREHIVAQTEPGANLILVHWTPGVYGHACTAEDVHEAFCFDPRLRPLHGCSAPTYRLDVLERRL
jgi:SAM-dependent methyltransferase